MFQMEVLNMDGSLRAHRIYESASSCLEHIVKAISHYGEKKIKCEFVMKNQEGALIIKISDEGRIIQ